MIKLICRSCTVFLVLIIPQLTNAIDSYTIDRPQIAIIDFGSQYTHLIARRVRELNVFSEIYSFSVTVAELEKHQISGIILSGGPDSVYNKNAPHLQPEVWNYIEKHNIPVLGICYGMGEMVQHYGGKVQSATKREYGLAKISKAKGLRNTKGELLYKIPDNDTVWMSHADSVVNLPKGFTTIAKSNSCPHAIIAYNADKKHKLYGIQFHPEVTHTAHGTDILRNFVIDIALAPNDWNMQNISEAIIKDIQQKVGPDKHVIGAVSGGVDSSVAAVLLNKAIGKRFHAIMVDNGLLRLNEAQIVLKRLKEKEGIDLHVVDASQRFIDKLSEVSDPELKRRIIGHLFVDIFQEEAIRIERNELKPGEKIAFLLQGTLYPDVIESVSSKGNSARIKTHHNVGGLPDKMHLVLLEPLRELFKDEVRTLGVSLGLEPESVWRHPFPGPGLAIRIIGNVTKERADRLRIADDIMQQEINKANVYNQISQAFVVLLPVKTVGVMGDGRTYEEVVALRSVTTNDFMTADWYRMDPDLMQRISSRIVNEVKGINRVVYDITSKPPGTIEWE